LYLYFSFFFRVYHLFGSISREGALRADLKSARNSWYFDGDSAFWFFSSGEVFDRHSALLSVFSFFFGLDDRESEFTFFDFNGYRVFDTSDCCYAFFKCWFVLQVSGR